MTNKEIDHIIACEIERMSKASNPFLRNGYMGMCVFLFKMYEFTSDKKYYQLAQEILTRACDLLKKGSKVNMIDGLSGIGTSIMCFFKKGYVSGDIYKILENIDNEIFRSIMQAIDYSNDFSIQGHEEALIEVAHYMSERVEFGHLPIAENKIYRLFVSKLINKLYQHIDFSFYLEPIPFSYNYQLARFILLLRKAYSAKIGRSRIIHIWGEMRSTILAQTPFYDCNKLMLSYALEMMLSIIPNDVKLKEVTTNFKNNISILHIAKEFPSNAMSMLNGVPGMIKILKKKRAHLPQAEVISLMEKLETSCYYPLKYEKVLEDQFIGYNGILGFIIAYQSMKEDLAFSQRIN